MSADKGVEWAEVVGVRSITAHLFRMGWTGADLKEFVDRHKREHMNLLEHFSGGALAEQEGTPLYPLMVEVTALRYALEKTKPDFGDDYTEPPKEGAA